jgi:hypothetical protein
MYRCVFWLIFVDIMALKPYPEVHMKMLLNAGETEYQRSSAPPGFGSGVSQAYGDRGVCTAVEAGQHASVYCKVYRATARCCFLRKEVMAADCDTDGYGALRSRTAISSGWRLTG